jgi:DNA polymerase III sliding clamp (beta) subunit (PCNA family)
MKERVTLERETFLNSLRRVSLLPATNQTRSSSIFQNNIDITANTPESAAKSPCLSPTRSRISIAFNPEFSWRRC